MARAAISSPPARTTPVPRPSWQAVRVLAPEPAEAQAEAQPGQDRARQGLVDVGRRQDEKAREIGRDGGKRAVELGIAIGVPGGELAQLERGLARVAPEGDAAAL